MRGRTGIASAATLIGVLFFAAAPSGVRQANAAATPGTPLAGEPTAAPADATISIDDYLAGVSKPGLTDAKKKEFAEKHEGKKVTWTGYVRAVSRNKSRDGDTFLVILKTKPVSDPPPGAFVASFDVADEKTLVALQENQKVTVSGTLSVRRNPTAPLVMDATLDE